MRHSFRALLVGGTALLAACPAPCEVWVIENGPRLRFAIADDRNPWFGDPTPQPLRSAHVYRCQQPADTAWSIVYDPDRALLQRGTWSHRTPPAPSVLGELEFGVSPSSHYVVQRPPTTLVAKQCYRVHIESDHGGAVLEFLPAVPDPAQVGQSPQQDLPPPVT